MSMFNKKRKWAELRDRKRNFRCPFPTLLILALVSPGLLQSLVFAVCEAAAGGKMVRKLKFHEQKLLKKLDLVNWEAASGNLAELRVLRRFRLQRREDYTRYNQLSRAVRELARRIRDLGEAPESAAFRARSTAALLEKLYAMGLVASKSSLELCDRVSASSFCRRRLPCLLLKLRMAQNLKSAVTFVEQGHVRVGARGRDGPSLLGDSGDGGLHHLDRLLSHPPACAQLQSGTG
uniref:IMP U3 small nucleolar ribonucleoprotein 3 n=1 Tax=Podarcis muralis TaxID=64176 RepID=A0A670HS96_PODMU